MARDIKVLIVNGEYSVAGGLALMLNRQGFLVNVAHDGQSAIQIVSEWKPEIVLLSMEMPEMSGSDIAMQIRAVLSSSRVILLMDPDLVPEQSPQHGTVTREFVFLPKAIDPDDLVRTLRSTL